MTERTLVSRYRLVPDHAIMTLRVAFADDSQRTFEDFVHELVDTIGVRPGTTNSLTDSLDIQLVGVEEDAAGANRGIVEIAVPCDVLPPDGAIPLMLAIATYGSVYRFVRGYQVVNLDFPPQNMVQSDLPGPKYGSGMLPDARDRTRLGLIIKPRFVASETVVRGLVADAARADIDYVTDDELTVGNSGLPFLERVSAVVEELGKAELVTGRRIPYIVNVTGGFQSAMARATVAKELGADAVMVNTVAMGYDMVTALACDPDGLPVVANSIGRGVLTSGPGYRIAPELLCKLARLAGADGVYTGPLVGSISTMTQHAERYRVALTEPFHGACVRKPAAAVMSGGLAIPEIVENARLYRADLFLSLGLNFVRPWLRGVPARVIIDCIRDVTTAKLVDGTQRAAEVFAELTQRDAWHREALKELRAIEVCE